MGNKVAKEFHDTQLGRGSLNGTETELISPELVMRGAKSTIINEEEIRHGVAGPGSKMTRLVARHYINQDNNDMLFQVHYMQKSSTKSVDKNMPRSIASDRDGFILYVDKKVVMPDGQKRVYIYKTSAVYPNQPAAKDTDIKVENNTMYLAAVIFDCQQQATQKTACAYLAVVIGRCKSDDTGCKLQDLYKAVKIPKVKNGVLVIDMNARAVGKACMIPGGTGGGKGCSPPEQYCDGGSFATSRTATSSNASCASSMASSSLDERSTTYEIAPGAEAAAVIAVASSLF
jgi:hypothetical protein